MKYRPELDGLRAVAVLAVVCFHLLKPVFPAGYIGVDIFFVLSGFLITGLLAREVENSGRVDYRGFLLRRARRLLPALLVLVAAYVLVAPFLWPKVAERRWFDAAVALAYTTNIREAIAPFNNPLSHTWTLGIEEQFYILWPLALPALLRLPRATAARLLLAIWGALSLLRIPSQAWPAFPGAHLIFEFNGSGLFLGAALALRPLHTRWGAVAVAALLPLVFVPHEPTSHAYADALAEICAAMAIANPPKLLSARPMVFIGKISYSLYLWHLPVTWGHPFIPREFFGLLSLSVVLACASYYGIERRFQRRSHDVDPGHVEFPLPESVALGRQNPFDVGGSPKIEVVVK